MLTPSGSFPRAEAPRQPRPKVFPPGTPIGLHLRVERVVRHAPDRILYLVNNARPRWYTRKCWECGNEHSPSTAQSCTYCARTLAPRRFLMSARWNPASASAYQAYAHLGVHGRCVARPLALYRYREQLLAFYPWAGHNLLVNMPAPIGSELALSVCVQLAEGLARLHRHGVALSRISADQVMIAPDGDACLFDLEVERIAARVLAPSDDLTASPQRELRDLAAMLASYTSLQDADLLDFFQRVRRGGFATGADLAAGVSELAWRRSSRDRPAQAAAQTDTGLVRDLNEDDWIWRRVEGGEVYAVADGMGGHNHGEVAASLVTRTFVRHLRRQLPGLVGRDQVQRAVLEAMVAANTAMCAVSDERRQQMGTTLAAAVVRGREVYVASVGDSRVYLWREGTFTQVTEDHSVVAAMVAAGKITAQEARGHPKANVLLQYLGGSREIDVDVHVLEARRGDRLLLCSDGLWAEVDDDALALVVSSEPDPRQVVRRLIRAANDAGGRDNVTAIVVEIGI